MALTEEELLQLPPSIQAILRSQGAVQQGVEAPSWQASGQKLSGDLQGALGRRFGQMYGAEFDPVYDAQVRTMMGELPQMQAGWNTQRQRLGEDFSRAAGDLDRQNTRATDSHLEAMADRGIGRSGANLLGQERIGEAFQRGIQSAVQGRTRGYESLEQSAAGAMQNIRSRLSATEAAATERSRVKEEARRFQEEQRRLEQERLAREEQMQREAQARAEEQQRQMQEQINAMNLAASQPMPGPSGAYSGGGGGGGGGGGAPAPWAGHSVATLDFREYDINNPDSVRALQQKIGVRPDGRYGAETDRRLRELQGFTFGGRAADPYSGMGGSTLGKTRGAFDR